MPQLNKRTTVVRRLVIALAIGTGVSVFLLIVGMVSSKDAFYWFLLWNLFLAWLPFVFAVMLGVSLTKRPWLSWQNLLLTIAWLGFLPNSFYIVSDLVHLGLGGEFWKLYDSAMLVSFILNGLLLGYISIYYVHKELLRRVETVYAHLFIGLVLLSSSFAIYLGRYLRWNTWDVLFSPAGLLFDISDRLINPSFHLQTFAVTGTFFVLLGGFYIVIYHLANLSRSNP